VKEKCHAHHPEHHLFDPDQQYEQRAEQAVRIKHTEQQQLAYQ
jgi:hypothetical protein